MRKKELLCFSLALNKKKTMFNNFLFTTYEGAEWTYYKGALFHSGFAVNQLVFDEIKKLLPNPANKKILEIGPGEGAMALMLSDAGYAVECVDIGDFELVDSDIKLRILDVDKGLKKSLGEEKYDLVYAVEVIEHLQHPWTMVKEAFEILHQRGCFILSTPNITSFVSRAKFLTSGEFYLFDKLQNAANRHDHITPLPWYIIEYMFRTVGFDGVVTKQAQRMSVVCLQSWKHILLSIIRLAVYPFCILKPAFSTGKQIVISGAKPNL